MSRFRVAISIITIFIMSIFISCDVFEKQPEFFDSTAFLADFKVSSGHLSPVFVKTIFNYSTTLPHNVSNYRITATGCLGHSKIEYSLNKSPFYEIISGKQSDGINLKSGNNTLLLTITAQDKTTVQNYKVTINKEYNANLASLELKNGLKLQPAFSPTTYNYQLYCDNSQDSIDFTPAVSNGDATIEVLKNNNSFISHTINTVVSLTLKAGANQIRFRITNNSTVKIYTLTITKGYYIETVRFEDVKDVVIQDQTIDLSYFRAGKYEVSNKEWAGVVTWANLKGYTLPVPAPDATPDNPVSSISWRDALVWCNAVSEKDGLNPCYYSGDSTNDVIKSSASGSIDTPVVKWDANGYRLPTEAEWEYAARFLTDSSLTSPAKASGETNAITLDDVAWYSGNSDANVHARGKKTANASEMYDMSGNISEFCFDVYLADVSGWKKSDPFLDKDATERVIRGGSWGDTSTDCATDYRGSSVSSSDVNSKWGFRVFIR